MFTGESLTHHIKPMKHFTAIAPAAVIGASLLVPNPVEARNGWVHVSTQNGVSSYVKPLDFSGRYRKYIYKANNINMDLNVVADYNSWNFRYEGQSGWNAVMPGSVGETLFETVCR